MEIKSYKIYKVNRILKTSINKTTKTLIQCHLLKCNKLNPNRIIKYKRIRKKKRILKIKNNHKINSKLMPQDMEIETCILDHRGKGSLNMLSLMRTLCFKTIYVKNTFQNQY